MTGNRPLRFGSRGSPLALVQAAAAADRFAACFPDRPRPEIIAMRTTGDRIQDRPLAEVGGKGLFAKELEEALLAGTIDAAVHSLKDMETQLPGGLIIAACLPREDPRDVLICESAESLDALPRGARVGTSSVRRAAQLLAIRPDIAIVPLRGNVGTRLGKIAEGVADATLLAAAGLARLGIDPPGATPIETEVMLPAAGQGIVAIECRADDSPLRASLARLSDADAMTAAEAERGALAELDGSCRTPIGAFASIENGDVDLRLLVASLDGSRIFRARRGGPAAQSYALGREAGAALRREVPASVLAEMG
ncbi:MAG: hydroxymethylbilane synthase [Bauldia litoralis]